MDAAMSLIVFTVSQERNGWFVDGAHAHGPFASRERALDLAEGMATAIIATGQGAEIMVAANPNLRDPFDTRWPQLDRMM
jgi:hypothetical protein